MMTYCCYPKTAETVVSGFLNKHLGEEVIGWADMFLRVGLLQKIWQRRLYDYVRSLQKGLHCLLTLTVEMSVCHPTVN